MPTWPLRIIDALYLNYRTCNHASHNRTWFSKLPGEKRRVGGLKVIFLSGNWDLHFCLAMGRIEVSS